MCGITKKKKIVNEKNMVDCLRQYGIGTKNNSMSLLIIQFVL